MNTDQSTKKLSNDKGFLLFNHQSSLDYNKIANICVQRLKNFFPEIPVAVCGDPINQADYNIPLTPPKNARLYQSGPVAWHNLGRSQSYDVSPFDTTIVLDTDIIVNSKQLQIIFDSNHSLLMHKTVYNLEKNKTEVWKVGKSDIDMYFATVLKFVKNNETKKFFDCWKNILKNYNYYSKLYNFTSTQKRNDFAVSLALKQIVDFGDDTHCELPWPLPTSMNSTHVKSLDSDAIVLEDECSSFIVKSDVHVLNKESLAKC